VRTYIGIDNGSTGSVGIITPTNDKPYLFFPTPTKDTLNYQTKKAHFVKLVDQFALEHEFTALIAAHREVKVLVEKPFTMKFATPQVLLAHRTFQQVLDVLERLGYGYDVIPATKWQKELLPKKIKGKELKKASLGVGKRLFPDIDWDDYKDADGLLIAEYCRRMFQ
jgi:hypothetical protein